MLTPQPSRRSSPLAADRGARRRCRGARRSSRRSSRGARAALVLRALALALVLAGARQPVAGPARSASRCKDVVALSSIDRSTSQTLGDRAAHDRHASAPSCSAASARMPDVEPRFVEAGDAEGDDGTRLFAALAERARRRAAGPARRRRHGHRRRRARHPGRSPRCSASARRCMRSSPARPDERDRRIVLDRGAALRHRRQGPDRSAPQVLERGGTGRRSSPCAATASRSLRREVAHRRAVLAHGADRAWRPERRRDRGRGARRTS